MRDWKTRERAHGDRADRLSAAHRARRERRERHPIEDFLWTYYSITPSELRRWHPGADVVLTGAGAPDRFGARPARATWRYYRPVGPGGDDLTVDVRSFFERRGPTVDYVESLLRRTMERPPQFGCFGLHEWAMVYRLPPERIRHAGLPLRVGVAETDRVVESHPIRCSHFDAYRFFTPDAAPLNEMRPTRESQPELEQSGCLHAGMDVYKWAGKLGPIVPGELLLDCFELARDIREVDMRASPYDVTGFTGADGAALRPIPIETAAGKRAYVALQREFARRGDALRVRVLDAIAIARAAHRAESATSRRAG